MIKWRLLILSGTLLTLCSLSAQTLRFSLPDTTIAPGTTVTLPIQVTNFDSIVSIQFSLTWDTDVLSYVNKEIADLENVAIGDFQANMGQLRFSWFNDTGTSKSLPDGSSIINLLFSAVGEIGDSTFLPIGNDPLPIQIAKATNEPGIFVLITPEQDQGLVRLGSSLGINIARTMPACPGEMNGSIQLSTAADTTTLTATWTGPAGFSATGFTLTELVAGTYVVAIRDLSGALLEELTVTITDPAALDAAVEITSGDCASPSSQVAITATGGTAPYTYNLAGEINTTGSYTNLLPGDYDLAITDANDCLFTNTVTVAEGMQPSLQIPSPQFLCDSLQLSGNISGTYLWSTGSTDSTITVRETGNYSVTVTNSFNCTATATIEVLPGEDLMATLDNDFTEFCPGDTLQLRVNGGDTFLWLGGDDILSATDIADPLVFPTQDTVLTVITSTSCATDTLQIPITVFEVTATAGPDTCIAPGDPVRLNAMGGIFYEWLPNPYPVSDPTIPNPMVRPEDSTTYVVNITDINGCVTTDGITVLLATDPAASILAINLITPNGDGLNDILEFKGADKFGTNTLKVYNRWGKLIYQKVDYQFDDERFDGTYQGADVPAGSYYYVLAFRSGEIKQTLTIVRD